MQAYFFPLNCLVSKDFIDVYQLLNVQGSESLEKLWWIVLELDRDYVK